jgi:hypothetical protein
MEFNTKGVLKQGCLLMNCDALPEERSHLCAKMGKCTVFDGGICKDVPAPHRREEIIKRMHE